NRISQTRPLFWIRAFSEAPEAHAPQVMEMVAAHSSEVLGLPLTNWAATVTHQWTSRILSKPGQHIQEDSNGSEPRQWARHITLPAEAGSNVDQQEFT
ncbi:MAG: hypothetical protein L6R40_008723, partial [Gallowayella cf. fulva]